MDFIKVILTSLLSVAALFLITKLIGHKQVAQFDFFDYISGITIGSIGAELATELEEPWKPFVALVIYGIVSVSLIILTNKLPGTRKFINGTPSILFDAGKIYRKNLKKAKLDLSEFMLLCRMQGFFDLDDIQTAVFEQNGKLSILPKAEKTPMTPADLNINVNCRFIGVELIADGHILVENLNRIGRNERWLSNQLRAQGFADEKDIMLAVFHKENDSVSFYKNASG